MKSANLQTMNEREKKMKGINIIKKNETRAYSTPKQQHVTFTFNFVCHFVGSFPFPLLMYHHSSVISYLFLTS